MNTIVNSVCSPKLANELLRVARIKREWFEMSPGTTDDHFGIKIHVQSILDQGWVNKINVFEHHAVSTWLIDGPKVFKPTPDQASAMEEIEVLISVDDYCQPYPAILVQLPNGYEPVRSVLCHKRDDGQAITMFVIHAQNDGNGVVLFSRAGARNQLIETRLQRFDKNTYTVAHNRAMRVALNSCLCLCNFGCRKAPMFAKQVNDDRKLASEQSDRGARARDRLKIAPYVLSFDQEVVFADRKRYDRDDLSEPTGREISPHWRKGHWRVQRYGTGLGMKKNVLIRPVLVRADKFVGEKSDTSVTYK